MAYPQLAAPSHSLAAVPTDAMRSNIAEQPFVQAVADGLEPDTDAGYADFQAWHSAGVAATLGTGRAELAALWASADAGSDYGQPIADIIANLTASGDAALMLAHVSPDVADRFVAAVTRYVPLFQAAITASRAAQNDPAYQHSIDVDLQRQQATARGVTVLGNGVPVPTEYIHYDVVLPDGVAYAVIDDPGGRLVYRWLSPAFRDLQAQTITERNGVTVCSGVVRGTGNWYEAGATGMWPDPSCDSTPLNFNGDYSLITQDILDALRPGNPGMHPGTPRPPVITQDMDGNPIPSQPGPGTTPILHNTTGGGATLVQSGGMSNNMKTALILGGIVLAGYVLSQESH